MLQSSICTLTVGSSSWNYNAERWSNQMLDSSNWGWTALAVGKNDAHGHHFYFKSLWFEIEIFLLPVCTEFGPSISLYQNDIVIIVGSPHCHESPWANAGMFIGFILIIHALQFIFIAQLVCISEMEWRDWVYWHRSVKFFWFRLINPIICFF